jgi:peptide deformylase
MIREILTYPDKRLYQKSHPIESFDKELHDLLDDMYDTMVSKEGVGLAAIQINVPKRVFIMHIPLPKESEEKETKFELYEIVNPVILQKKDEVVYNEGCLSVPGYYEDVKRARFIEVEYYDRDGNKQTKEFKDLSAIAFQHELDHLDGHLFIERLSYIKRKKFQKEWKKQQKGKK